MTLALCLAVVVWCLVHSLLLAETISAPIKRGLGPWACWYRLGYNLLAIVSLVPLVLLLKVRPGPTLFAWSGWLAPIRYALLLSALACFYLGGRSYDYGIFSGIRQIRTGADSVLLGKEIGFSRRGILGMMRHPWYGGGVLLLWSLHREYGETTAWAYGLFTLYLLGGAFWEERRLAARFGEPYLAYQREVSMFFTWKWLKKRWKRKVEGDR